MENNRGFDNSTYHDTHCESTYCRCDECITLAILVFFVFPPLGFVIFWGWVFCSK